MRTHPGIGLLIKSVNLLQDVTDLLQLARFWLCGPRTRSLHLTLTPVRTPVVDTLKSTYASSSGVGGLYARSNFFFGGSSVFITRGHGLLFTTLRASLDLRSFASVPVVRIACD